jgi:predicted DsbA family dithiol-disulfide isomerase
MISIDVFLDHTCPFSYMAFSAVRRAMASTSATMPGAMSVTWRPLPIAGGGMYLSPADAAMHAARQSAEWPQVQALAASRFGLTLRPPIWGMDAHAPAAAAHWVRQVQPDAETEFHQALFSAGFESERDLGDSAVPADSGDAGPPANNNHPRSLADIGNPVTLAAIARSIGVDPSGLEECLTTGAMQLALAADAAMAEAHGATAVPAILVGGSHLLLGAQPEAVLRMTVAQMASRDTSRTVVAGTVE